MQKKLLAVAVAGALFSPLAMAQSSVTISGAVVVSVDSLSSSNNPAKPVNRESRVNDESSSIIFNVTEDLGGGLQGIVKVDVKPNVDTSAIAASGESFVGLNSSMAGRFTAGRHNFHFFKSPWDGYGLSTPLKTHPTGLIDFAGGGKVSVANATRTNNSVAWLSPNWSGFQLLTGYSFNPTAAGAEADMTAANTARKGRAWNFNPTFGASNWGVGYTFWDSKLDAPAATVAAADQRSNSVYGHYQFGAFKVGGIWNTTTLKTAVGATAGTEVSKRTAWSIPVRWTAGQHSVLAHYTRANDDKSTAGVNDGAKMWVAAYAYSLSKRTHLSLSYARLDNNAGGAYDFFTNASGGGLASTNSGTAAGEDQRLLSLGIRHNF